ncbi:MAG: TraB/GumN family protein [Acidobacteriota bacterium]
MRRWLGALAVVVGIVAPMAAQDAPRHFLWSVRSEGGPPTYLVGSLHILTPDHYPLAPPIERAFETSTVLVEEVDLDDLGNPLTAMSLLGRALLTDGRTLDELVAPDTWRLVSARAEAVRLPLTAIRRMKPWMAALALTAPALAEAGFRAELGVDRHFFDRAKARDMERRALETVAFQLERLDQMPPEVQEGMLKAVIADLDTQLANVKAIAGAWATGDVRTLERMLLAAFLESPAMYERLLVDRNRTWLTPITTCVEKGERCFVVVGAAHLVGPHSVVALLEARGYRVEQH